MKKYDIYINNNYAETVSTLEEAKRRVEREKRQDLYEKSIGYTNKLPIYEIKEV